MDDDISQKTYFIPYTFKLEKDFGRLQQTHYSPYSTKYSYLL